MLETVLKTESQHLPAHWLPLLAHLAGAADLPRFWDALIPVLAKVVPHHTAFMWADYLDAGISTKPAVIFEAPYQGRPADFWEGRRKYHLTDRYLHDHAGLKLYRMTDVVPRSRILKSEFYHRFMQPDGWEYAVTLAFWEKRELRAALALYRTEEQGDIAPEEYAELESLHPFIEGVLFRLLEQDREKALHARVEEFVRGLPVGLILLDWDLQPVFVNDEGYKQAFLWIHGAVRPWGLHYRKDFRVPRELHRICEGYRRSWLEHHVPGQGLHDAQIERVMHSANPEMHAVVSTQSERIISAHRPNFLIRFEGLGSHAHEAFTPSGEQLKLLAQLTPAERQVAILVLEGLSNQEIALRLHRERCTVKDHLSHIYGKLGIRNRTQLASLLSQR
jgi:DNA-binding CsgD family transcriptional regulator